MDILLGILRAILFVVVAYAVVFVAALVRAWPVWSVSLWRRGRCAAHVPGATPRSM